MRVLLSAYACEAGRGSEPGFGWNCAVSLAEVGHDVTVLTTPKGRPAIEEALDAQPMGNLTFRYVDVRAAAVRYLRGHAAVYAHYIMWQALAYRHARELAADIDIVHHVSWGSLMGGTELWRLNRPLIFGPIGGAQTVPAGLGSLVRGDYLRLVIRAANIKLAGLGPERRYLSQAALVLATNAETLQLAKKLGAPHVEYFLDTGLPDSFLASSPPDARSRRPMRALWVGRIMPRKALPLALAALAKTVEHVELTILGDGPDRDTMLAMVERLGLGDRVRHVGWVPWDDMPAQYRDHDVFLFTSVLDSFGGQLLEAMGSGLPVVALDHQGAKTFVPDTAGIKVPIGSVDETAVALAAALDQLAADPHLRAQMGAEGWKFAKTQTWTERAFAMTELYERVVSDGGS